ncbi:MAG: hypothetical protein A2Y70_01170 [Candidatus Aminicenantes bacterium RBG_13_64_14]|nr:MAG: hypothetical protein A2Y70_01170 [Candidatus Aminicenantes bacterium RBG_13_64_14]
MDKTERMKDGTEVTIRRIVANDIDKLMEFYGSLFVKDTRGGSQDLIVMSCDVKDLWKELDRTFSESDWQRCR